jgi:hypothetical protein
VPEIRVRRPHELLGSPQTSGRKGPNRRKKTAACIAKPRPCKVDRLALDSATHTAFAADWLGVLEDTPGRGVRGGRPAMRAVPYITKTFLETQPDADSERFLQNRPDPPRPELRIEVDEGVLASAVTAAQT